MPASSSTAVSRETIACFLLSCAAPMAIVTDNTVGIAMGTPPTISTSACSRGLEKLYQYRLHEHVHETRTTSTSTHAHKHISQWASPTISTSACSRGLENLYRYLDHDHASTCTQAHAHVYKHKRMLMRTRKAL